MSVQNPLRAYVRRLAATPLGIYKTEDAIVSSLSSTDPGESLRVLTNQLRAYLPDHSKPQTPQPLGRAGNDSDPTSILSSQIWNGIALIDKILQDIEANRDGLAESRSVHNSIGTSDSFDTSLSTHVNPRASRLNEIGQMIQQAMDASQELIDDSDLMDAYARSRQLGSLVRRYKNLESESSHG
ncbi:hypothetical protein GMRT_14270 [Giardia muris]|uniref:Uncharacterized protein n=1 Tax=Giardia muris TaxID=5742 RepID=A0A4Z1TCA4_GIAMU|nr:hypothetical protein GMRT_14270 [Giardia muris]|eukprot:TNJ30189.1 hypothetical protein GMRT_14270 [Giardia muris]